MTMFRRSAGMAGFAAVFGLVSAAAQAQQVYCENRVQATSFYNDVQRSGSRATVSYYVRLQNTSGVPLRYSVTFAYPQASDRQDGKTVASLDSYEQVAVLLGRQNVNNPAGTGALSPYGASGTPSQTQIICQR